MIEVNKLMGFTPIHDVMNDIKTRLMVELKAAVEAHGGSFWWWLEQDEVDDMISSGEIGESDIEDFEDDGDGYYAYCYPTVSCWNDWTACYERRKVRGVLIDRKNGGIVMAVIDRGWGRSKDEIVAFLSVEDIHEILSLIPATETVDDVSVRE